MWWVLGVIGFVFCVLLLRSIQRLQQRNQTKRVRSDNAKGHGTVAAPISEWELLSRDVQRHMHNLCVYRDAIKHALHDPELFQQHEILQKWFERLICEIADHMTLIRRAHRLIHGYSISRKETDPDIIKQTLRRRCHNSAVLCEELSNAIDIVDIKRRRTSTQGVQLPTGSSPAGQASRQNQTSN